MNTERFLFLAVILGALMLSGCSQLAGTLAKTSVFTSISDSGYKEKLKDVHLGLSAPVLPIHSTRYIAAYVCSILKYRSDSDGSDKWDSPSTAVARGFGDCEEFVFTFLEVSFLVVGTKYSIALINEASFRSVRDGGVVNHMVVLDPVSNRVFDPQLGVWGTADIAYSYTFDEVFYH